MKDYIYGDDGNDILYGDEQADPSNNLNNPDYYGDDEIYGGDGDDWLLGRVYNLNLPLLRSGGGLGRGCEK